MEYTFNEILASVTHKVEPRAWEVASSSVAEERKRIEAFIEQGGQAYGFTTLFGHLDSIQREQEGRANLYRGHVVGHPSIVTPEIGRAIVAVKLCQLSQGGTGISLNSYMRLREVFSSNSPVIRIDLHASYGSGDVVPGAWLVDSTFAGPWDLERGDLMALINGAYIPAGILLGSYRSIEQALSRAQSLVRETRDLSIARRVSEEVQLPVSLRDLEPLNAALDKACDRIQTSITRAVNRKSGNPLFDIGKSGVRPVSNSSFLDFEFSIDVGAVHEVVRIVGAYIVASTRWASNSAESEADELYGPLVVQLPKVCKAYEEGLTSRSSSLQYSQVESRGVEDISDSSLRRVLDLNGAISTLDQMSDLLANALHRLKND